MTIQTIQLEELQTQSISDVIQHVVTDRLILLVRLPDGAEVIIQPKPNLKPLPVMEGLIPDGWKEDIYA